MNNDSTQLGGVVRVLCPRTTPQDFVRSVFFLLKYSSVPEGKFPSIYSFQLACHPVRFAPLEFLRKLIDAINRTVVAPVFSAAKRNPWFAKNTHAKDYVRWGTPEFTTLVETRSLAWLVLACQVMVSR